MAAQVEIGGVRIAYDVHGAGEPVLLIASLGMQKEAWLASVVPPLTDAGYEVVTFDMRGIGESDALPAPYSVADIAADTAGLIEHLGIAPCRLVGFSLGGFVAEELARRRPELVRACVLLASAGPMTAYGRLVVEAGLEVAATGVEVPRRERVKDVLAEILTPRQLQDDSLVESWIALLEASPEWRNPGRHGQYAAVVDWVQGVGAAGRWGAISVPVLVVAFEDDVAFPPASGSRFADGVAGAELVVVTDAGHGGPFTHAGGVAEHVLDFFRRI